MMSAATLGSVEVSIKPIHMRDPLFRELFANADKIVMRSEATEKGVKVTRGVGRTSSVGAAEARRTYLSGASTAPARAGQSGIRRHYASRTNRL